MVVADMIIINLLYVICCIPIFTIGAAQAGLFTGIRVLMDPEDDTSVAKAFFRGFSSGFGKITIVNVILLALLAGLTLILGNTLILMYAGGSKLSVIICGVIMIFAYILHTISAPFHATFDCSVMQLLRNSFLLFMAYPLRCFICAALVLLPIIILMIWPNIILGGILALATLYYSFVYSIIHSLMKKPFKRLKDNFYATQTNGEE